MYLLMQCICGLFRTHWNAGPGLLSARETLGSLRPFFLMFQDCVCVLTRSCSPHPCLCSSSGFWVKVTNHPGFLRTEVSPKQDFKCKNGTVPADWNGPVGHLSSSTSRFSFLPCWLLFCLKLVLSLCSLVIFILSSYLLSSYSVRGCAKCFHIAYLTE